MCWKMEDGRWKMGDGRWKMGDEGAFLTANYANLREFCWGKGGDGKMGGERVREEENAQLRRHSGPSVVALV